MSLTARFVNGFGRSPRDALADGEASNECLDGELARLLVRAHEAQSNGWFWATDRVGRLIFLTERVAKELKVAGESVYDQLLTEVFEVSGESEGAERTLAFHLHARTSFVNFEVRSRDDTERVWTISGRPHIDEFGQFRGFVGHACRSFRRAPLGRRDQAPGDVRPADRPRQPPRMRASLDQVILQTGTDAPPGRPVHARPRPLQGGQRHARPPERATRC